MEERGMRIYQRLQKCLDKEKGITEENMSGRFGECWEDFKKERQGIFK